MKIFNSLKDIVGVEKAVIAVGNFDGIHEGHRELIRRTVKSAEVANMKSAVFTFSNHPRNLLNKSKKTKNIMYWEEKSKMIEEMGVDYMFNIPFTDEIKSMDPIEYIDKLLLDTFKMREVYCGFNYRFGYKAEGNVETLIKEGVKKGFGIHVLEPFKIDGQIVSSTLIRKLIEEGQVEECIKYLGRNYSVGGEVVVGNRLGKTIGFPTSNLVMDEDMVAPPNGVYVTYCIYNGKKYPSITNVGVKPTIGEYNKNIETHIFNFDKELYGKHIKVEFLKKTRPEVKFDSVEELTKQITQDCIRAKAFHQAQGTPL